MLISLIKKNKIRNLILPNNIYGNYWVTDYISNNQEQNLINIEAFEGNWKLNSNQDVVILENNNEKNFVILQNYGFYLIEIKSTKERLLLHCAPVYDNTYKYYYLVNDISITIGSDIKSIINYKHPLVNKEHAVLKFKDNKFSIQDNKSKIGVFVNDQRINGEQELYSGDVIFISGLKIIVLIENSKPVLIINNPCNLVALKPSIFEERKETDYDKNINYKDIVNLDAVPYSEDDYFHKKPRFKSNFEKLVLKIDSPPASLKGEEMPLLLTVGPMITMAMISGANFLNIINNIMNGLTTWEQSKFALITSGAMIASMLLWPLLIRIYQKRKRNRKEKKRITLYTKYIEEKKNLINEKRKKQIQVLNEDFSSMDECREIIFGQKMSFWGKKNTDEDFLNISLGYGTVPMFIDIQYPEEHFSLEHDKLKDLVNDLIKEPKDLTNVPISYSLVDKYITAIIGDSKISQRLIDNILLQIFTFHSYDDVKIVLLTNEEREQTWDYLKISPYCLDDTRKVRYFGSNNNEIKEICYNLDRIYQDRKEYKTTGSKKPLYEPYYIIITDCYKNIRNFDFIKKVLDDETNMGFSMLIMNDKVSNLPNGCQSFINVSNKECEVFENILNSDIKKFKIDFTSNYDMYECVKKLANIPIEITRSQEGKLPNKYGFLEMYDVGKVEQLNSLSRWEKNNPILTLQAPVGIGKSGEKLTLDLHEKFHGPHGLIAGMTGSGKSEFIITYILSMAINYHPNEVQFILIDYKGGGLANAFLSPETGECIPHIVGTVTNLDSNEINRSLASIESELKRRQRAFNDAKIASNESTIDIYKYQNLYRKGIVSEPIAHLFIICDEFAELKQQQPDFMQQLISTARIGRSLGVHLILATQKPAGVVDNQIWSNTRFRVCLRVQDKSDSSDVIKCPDAAFIKQTGRFFLQVGYNEIFILGQAAWAGNKYIPTEKLKKNVDTSLDFIDNIGYVIKNVETETKQELVSNGEELSNIVKYIIQIGNDQNVHPSKLWLAALPAYINLDSLIKKYQYSKRNFGVEAIIGEYDVPSRQSQNLLKLNFLNGNTLIYGIAGSGKENFITTMVYSTMELYSPDEVNYYILDFGSETLRMFNKSPIVGDVILSEDKDKVTNLYKFLYQNIETRKGLFANYNGSFEYYCKNSGKTIPSIIIVINNYEAYSESYNDFDEILQQITRECVKYGIYFVITVSNPNGIRYRLKSNFSQIFTLQQNDSSDYTAILGNIHKMYPSKIFGRGIISYDSIYEFQTAMVTSKENISEYVREKCNQYLSKYNKKAKSIPVLPRIVKYDDIAYELDDYNLIVGIEKNSLNISKYPIYKNFINLILTSDISIIEKFTNCMIKQLELKKGNIIVINATSNNIFINNTKKNRYFNDNFDSVFESLKNFIEEKNELFIKNNRNPKIFKDESKITCIIIGVETFKNKLKFENSSQFGSLFDYAKDLSLINYIFIDSQDKIKKLEYESWYVNNVNTSQGIWIGNGIADQFSLKINSISKEMRQEIPESFCYVIKRGKPDLVKYVENFEVPEIFEE